MLRTAGGKAAALTNMSSQTQDIPPRRIFWTAQVTLLLAQVASESKMTVDVDEYVSSFRTDLCDVLAAWSRGSKFGDIMKMTDVFEVR